MITPENSFTPENIRAFVRRRKRQANPIRPHVFDEAKREKVLDLLALGCSRRVAARYVGCAPSTITKAAQRDPEYAAQLARAEENAQVTSLRRIDRAARKAQYWRAAAWMLERQNPEDFALRRPHRFTMRQNVAIFKALLPDLLDGLPEERRQRLLDKLAKMIDDIETADELPARAAALLSLEREGEQSPPTGSVEGDFSTPSSEVVESSDSNRDLNVEPSNGLQKSQATQLGNMAQGR